MFSLLQCSKNTGKSTYQIDNDIFKVIKVIKSPKAIVQGISYDNTKERLYESNGLYANSIIKKLKLPSFETEISTKLDNKYYAGGVAECGDNIYQLTWQNRKILKYNKDLTLLDTITMDTKMKSGEGLSPGEDGYLLATDGSSMIYFLDCNDLKVKKSIAVTSYNGKLKLGDLVFAKNFIYANNNPTNNILKIDYKSGKVVKIYDMTDLAKYELHKNTLTQNYMINGDILNGITYIENAQVFLVTGKKWGYIYEIKFK